MKMKSFKDLANIPKPGSAFLRSQLDSRWHVVIDVKHLNMGKMPPELKEKLDELKEKFGRPPTDLEWGGMKF